MSEGKVRPIIVPPGEGQVLNVLGEKITCKLAGEDSGGTYSIIEEVSPPGGGPPPHVHHETDEIFYVLEGEYEIKCGGCGGERQIAKPGTLAVLPRGRPHTVRNIGNGPGRVLVIMSPAKFEHFFREIDLRSRVTEVDPPAAMQIAMNHDVEFLAGPSDV